MTTALAPGLPPGGVIDCPEAKAPDVGLLLYALRPALAMSSLLFASDGDRFIVISEIGDDERVIDPSFMDTERSAEALIVEIQLGAHRPDTQKAVPTADICRQLGDAAGIAPDDVFMANIPVPNEDFSFGRGIAPLAGAAAR